MSARKVCRRTRPSRYHSTRAIFLPAAHNRPSSVDWRDAPRPVPHGGPAPNLHHDAAEVDAALQLAAGDILVPSLEVDCRLRISTFQNALHIVPCISARRFSASRCPAPFLFLPITLPRLTGRVTGDDGTSCGTLDHSSRYENSRGPHLVAENSRSCTSPAALAVSPLPAYHRRVPGTVDSERSPSINFLTHRLVSFLPFWPQGFFAALFPQFSFRPVLPLGATALVSFSFLPSFSLGASSFPSRLFLRRMMVELA